MMMSRSNSAIISALDSVRGRVTYHAPLDRVTWFRVGGPAEALFKPADVDDLGYFLSQKPQNMPHTLLGVGSNLLVRDGGVDGVVIRLGRAFAGITCREDGRIVCGGAALDVHVAETAAQNSLTGLEFLSGIPGTIGGALRMNAGAYGKEMSDVLVSAVAMDGKGQQHILTVNDFGFRYRHCDIPLDWVFIEAVLQATPGDESAIRKRIQDIQAARHNSQPVRSRTGGSTFANPNGYKAWELIDAAGCRGLQRGGAQVSEQHCNFLINTGTATAADLEGLGEDVRQKVIETSGVPLRWEIKRIGRYADETSDTQGVSS